jgi:CRISPR-associated endonuclease Cas2
MSAPSLYIATYDISCDRERAKVADVLEGFGVRAQFSVFECRLSRGLKVRLVAALEALDVQSGTIHLYPARTDRKPLYLGPQKTTPDFTERSGDAAWII